MSRLAAVGPWLVIAACAGLLGLAIFPGSFHNLLIPALLFAFLAFPIALIASPFVVVWAMRAWRRRREAKRAKPVELDLTGDAIGAEGQPSLRNDRRMSLFAGLVVVLTLALGLGRVPVRLGFALSRSAFEKHLADASPPPPQEPPSRGFGLYRVDRYAVYPRGGVYFRTNTGRDMIDTLSFGFVYRPNPQGSPFGAAGYAYRHVWGDWYEFTASDDWY